MGLAPCAMQRRYFQVLSLHPPLFRVVSSSALRNLDVDDSREAQMPRETSNGEDYRGVHEGVRAVNQF